MKIEREDLLEAITQSNSNSVVLPDNLPGIDIATGLQRIGDKKHLYKKLLIRFYESYGDSAQEIRAYLKQGEPELACQLSHTVKGISSNLSIDSVYQAAVALEVQLKSGDMDKAWTLMDLYENALDQVNKGLLELKREDEAVQSSQTATPEQPCDHAPDFSKIGSMLDKIDAFLKENNLEVERCLEALAAELQDAEAMGFIDELKNQIDLFDFDNARVTFQKLKTRLKAMEK